MLAPRKTLWSTPDAVIDKAIEVVSHPLTESDCVLDIGCGDVSFVVLIHLLMAMNCFGAQHLVVPRLTLPLR